MDPKDVIELLDSTDKRIVEAVADERDRCFMVVINSSTPAKALRAIMHLEKASEEK